MDINKVHPKAVDMHTYVSKNENEFKYNFMNIYNNKCAYCGVSSLLTPKKMFQIDHIIYEKNKSIFKTKKEAGYMNNLALSCYECNSNKSDFLLVGTLLDELHPDDGAITNNFIRNQDDYTIEIVDEETRSSGVVEFYNKLKLGNQIHRLDYLLMNMQGLAKKENFDEKFMSELQKCILMLLEKRNLQ